MNQWAAPDRVRTVMHKPYGNEVTLPALSVSAISCGRR
jgi:hypothetical protein